MKENRYDDDTFFHKYSQMPRSVKGLEGAGEWHALKPMLPDFQGKRVLDLGCGFGWHCIYAAEQGAMSATGIDLTEKMLEVARNQTSFSNVEYICASMEDYDYPEKHFDAVISSLAFHYIKSFDDICAKVSRCLTPGGSFVFSAEHPVFTAHGRQEWVCDEAGNILHWPVDRYFDEGERTTRFLDEDVVKYHRTTATYIGSLLKHGFEITGLCEPVPAEEMLEMPGMKDELRRPMMLILSAEKRGAARNGREKHHYKRRARRKPAQYQPGDPA